MSLSGHNIPEKLGKYQITGILGRGAMGVVYKAWDPLIARHVALKAILRDSLDNDGAEQAIARFRNEAMAAGRLNHPGIVAIYDFGEEGNTSYIAMEFAEGQGLREHLRSRGTVKLSDVVELANQLLAALDYAHQRGVIHRDVKPGNIIVTLAGKLKITDFGIARIDTTNLTQTGMIVGTPSYMAPEQYTGQPVDRRADLFSAGVVVYEMLTGVKPFTGNGDVIAYQICHVPHAPPSRIDPTLPHALDVVMAHALAKKKEERYASAGEFAQALAAAITRAEGDESTMAATVTRAAPLIGETASMPAGWNPEALRALENALTPHIGPVARTLVKRAAAKSVSPAQLIEVLVNTLDGVEERKAFTARARMILEQTAPDGPTSSLTAATVATPRALPEAELELAVQRLTPYLGPISKVLVKKASARVRDVQALYVMLAENLNDDSEKATFLKQAGIRAGGLRG